MKLYLCGLEEPVARLGRSSAGATDAQLDSLMELILFSCSGPYCTLVEKYMAHQVFKLDRE